MIMHRMLYCEHYLIETLNYIDGSSLLPNEVASDDDSDLYSVMETVTHFGFRFMDCTYDGMYMLWCIQ